METTRSADGTSIAFESVGSGPSLILVVGAFNDRHTGGPLARFLAPSFTVLTYDRRGRGDSEPGPEYRVEREIEDLAAVLRAAGGTAAVLGYSSGAALALRAAAAGLPISRLALYEAPPEQAPAHVERLAALVASGRRGDAVEYFQREIVRIPEGVVAQLRGAPFRPALEAMAHTLVHDVSLIAEGYLALASAVPQSTAAIAGGASPPVLREVAETLARTLPRGQAVVIEGATHDLDPPLVGAALQRHFQ